MNGNLEPEERVYDCAVQAQGKWLGELAIALEKMGWDSSDNIAVEIGGTSVYEIAVSYTHLTLPTTPYV